MMQEESSVDEDQVNGRELEIANLMARQVSKTIQQDSSNTPHDPENFIGQTDYDYESA